MLRLGHAATVDRCLSLLAEQTWPALPIGLAAGPSVLPVLRDGAGNSPEGLIALGLLGDRAGVEFLIGRLADPVLAEFAALALNLITGAQLYEEVVVTEPADEDERFGAADGKMDPATQADASGPGPAQTTVRRLSHRPSDWRNWWQTHAGGCEPGQRLRNGQACTPAVLLENLTREDSPALVRQMAGEELAIRYAMDIPFESDMTVHQQLRSLSRYRQAVEAASGRFAPGTWYFAGHRLA